MLPVFSTREGEEFLPPLSTGRTRPTMLKIIQGCGRNSQVTCSAKRSSPSFPFLGKAPSSSRGNNSRRPHLRPPRPVRCSSTRGHRCAEKGRPLIVWTWNVSGIMKASRELDASRVVSGMDIVFLTETELPHNESLTLPGFMTFYPVCPPHSLRRLIALVDRNISYSIQHYNTHIITP